MPRTIEEQRVHCEELRVHCEALRVHCEALRKLAHGDANGHRWVEQYSYAWAQTAKAWVQACDVLKAMEAKRG